MNTVSFVSLARWRGFFLSGPVLAAVLVAALSLLAVPAPNVLAARVAQKKAPQAAWARESGEEAHPVLRNGKADFVYSPRAAEWVRAQGWEPVRFFCVMGRMAAALVIVEEGNDMRGTRPRDMPGVTEEELALARRHLGTMLKAGGDAPPIRH